MGGGLTLLSFYSEETVPVDLSKSKYQSLSTTSKFISGTATMEMVEQGNSSKYEIMKYS